MTKLKWFIIIFFFIGTIFFAQFSFAADPPLPTPIGRVVWVKGILKAIMPNKEERILQKTSVIYLNDTLKTDQKSQAQIVFTDNSLMTFRPATTFYIDKYEYHPKKKGSLGKYIVNLIEGGFRTITGLIAKNNPAHYQVNTPVATIGVRGTDYAVYFHAGELSMANYLGEPCMQNEKGSLCLNKKTRFGATTLDEAPVSLQETPAVFTEKLEIIPAEIEPFSSPAGKLPRSQGGTVSSFCIQ